nr:unnamed protein product [Callosobruchus analis]
MISHTYADFAADVWEITRMDGTRALNWNALPTIFSFSEIKISGKTAKVATLLLLMEKGETTENKGKTLDDIDLELQSWSSQENSDKSEKENINTNNQNEWKHVRQRRGANRTRRRGDQIVGTSNVETNDGFAGAPKRLWIYMGKCKPDSTVNGVRSYLERKSPGYNFNVVQLNTKGYYRLYRVDADVKLRDAIYTPDYWPVGVTVKRFKFLGNKLSPQNTDILDSSRPF